VKTPSGKQIACPTCASTDLRWSNKPDYLNFVMAFLFRDPIRCCRCGLRFYRRALTDGEYEKKVAPKPASRHDEPDETDDE
jgi:hypothetical protein